MHFSGSHSRVKEEEEMIEMGQRINGQDRANLAMQAKMRAHF